MDKLQKSSYRRPGTNLYVNPTSKHFDTRNPYSGNKNYGVWENKPAVSTVPEIKPPNPNDSKVSGVWESNPSQPWNEQPSSAPNPPEAKVSGIFENEPEKLFDPNYEKKKEEHLYIRENLKPGIIEAKKRAVEEQHRKFDKVGTKTKFDKIYDEDYIEENLKPGSIKAKQLAISQAQARFENFGKTDAEIEQMKKSKKFLSLSDSESELSEVKEATENVSVEVKNEEKVDSSSSEDSFDQKSEKSSSPDKETSTVNKTVIEKVASSDEELVETKPTLVQNAAPNLSDSDDDKEPEELELSKMDDTSSMTITCSSEGEVPDDEKPTSPFPTAKITTIDEEDENEKVYNSSAYVTSDADVSDIKRKSSSSISSSSSSSNSSTATLVEESKPVQAEPTVEPITAKPVDEQKANLDESLLTSIMKDVNKIEEPKQMHFVPNTHDSDSTDWNNSINDPQVHLNDSTLNDEPEVTKTVDKEDTTSYDSRDKLAFELDDQNETVKRNDRTASVKSDEPQITIIEPEKEMVQSGNPFHSDPSDNEREELPAKMKPAKKKKFKNPFKLCCKRGCGKKKKN